MKSKKIFLINVAGRYGYSFAVKCDAETEEPAIKMALYAGIFEDDVDADYATAEDITDSPYDVEHFKNCTHEL